MPLSLPDTALASISCFATALAWYSIQDASWQHPMDQQAIPFLRKKGKTWDNWRTYTDLQAFRDLGVRQRSPAKSRLIIEKSLHHISSSPTTGGILPPMLAIPHFRACRWLTGALRLSTARYVLHRLFVQRHGWHFKGLAPEGDSWLASTRGRKGWNKLPGVSVCSVHVWCIVIFLHRWCMMSFWGCTNYRKPVYSYPFFKAV